MVAFVPAGTLGYMTLAHLVFGATSAVLVYIALTRLVFGTTPGERVARVSYREVMAVFGRAGGRPSSALPPLDVRVHHSNRSRSLRLRRELRRK